MPSMRTLTLKETKCQSDGDKKFGGWKGGYNNPKRSKIWRYDWHYNTCTYMMCRIHFEDKNEVSAVARASKQMITLYKILSTSDNLDEDAAVRYKELNTDIQNWRNGKYFILANEDGELRILNLNKDGELRPLRIVLPRLSSK